MIAQQDCLTRAMLGPTNTGKTHFAVERLCAHSSGIMGFPLRLLAREIYERVVEAKGAANVGLVTGEERILPPNARWLLCTVESMPLDRDVAFVALDEAQLGIDRERGHVFTDRLLHGRGREETLILGSSGLAPLVRMLLPKAEILSRPRFSQLTYAGPKKLSRLPPRTVIIAFSADEVYALAEQVRKHFGGTAIVMGSLSPRTRNAQVAMYQAGEVDYIVATDAVGMGLNLDVNHIAFSGLSKFDGTRRRRLTVPEMAQIAGRAGRHQRDGTFGVVLNAGDYPEFSQEEIDRIEEHRFPPLNWLYWRNSDLDFSSPDALLSTLEASPPSPVLRPSPEADDHAVLRSLLSDPEVIKIADRELRTQRLWDACGLPDFRGTGPEFHARLVSRLYQHLAVGKGTIPTSMIADDVARLDTIQGNIPALASRLASVRTWTYVANRADWLDQPEHWAERTRAVDDRLSDALHRQLTERFVDRRTARLARDHQRIKLPGDFAVDADDIVTVLDESVGVLRGFRFQPDPLARTDGRKRLLAEAETRLPLELARRAVEVAGAPDSSFQLLLEFGQMPSIMWRNAIVATLKRGRELLDPDLDLDPSVARLDVAQRAQVQKRLKDFLAKHIASRLQALIKVRQVAFSKDAPVSLRAFLAPVAEASGVVQRGEVEATLRELGPEVRHQVRKLGLTIGSVAIFHPLLLKPGAMALRLALIAVRSHNPMPPLPLPGLGLLDRPAPQLANAARLAGYHQLGDQMIRLDLVERVALKLHEQREGSRPFVPDARLSSTVGIGTETLARLMRSLGFIPSLSTDLPRQWQWRGMRRNSRTSRHLAKGAP